MLLEGIKEFRHEGAYVQVQQNEKTIFALIIVEDNTLKESIQRAVQDLQIPAAEIPSTHVKTLGDVSWATYLQCERPRKAGDSLFGLFIIVIWSKEKFSVIRTGLRNIKIEHPFA